MKKCLVNFFLSLYIILVLVSAEAAPVAMTQTSDLNFGNGFIGDGVKVVGPGISENAENASFLITGDPGVTFTIALPPSIWMDHSTSSSQISVQSFTANPVSGSIPGSGQVFLYVGATRSAISAGLTTGSYAGGFTITVVH